LEADRLMQAAAQTFDGGAAFDRAAAEVYLRELRGPPAASRLAGKPVHQQPIAPAEPPLVAPPARRPSRRKSSSRTLAAVVIAIAAPASVGAGVFYWTTLKPAGPAPELTTPPQRDAAPAAQTSINAYTVTDPVRADDAEALKPSGLAAAYGRHSSRSRPILTATAAPLTAQAEDPAPDFPSYGILDPAPAGPRPDAAAN
jgi:hypothetical protein